MNEKTKDLIKILKENSMLCFMGGVKGDVDSAIGTFIDFNPIDENFHLATCSLVDSKTLSETEAIEFIDKHLHLYNFVRISKRTNELK